MDLNFAPKLRFKHNARRPWSNEEISRIPGIFFQDDYMRELGIDPKTQLISIYRNPYSYEIHSSLPTPHSQQTLNSRTGR
jgi:singapore isolate B (sub-type 7) whole genome shotgun sequence assembly, scaffold_13